jgi:hypothetical protein
MLVYTSMPSSQVLGRPTLPVCRHVINHCLTSTQLLRILFASPRTQHALEASFGAWHGVLPRNLCYLGGLISNGVPQADGYLFMVVGYPMEVGTIPLKDADSRGQSGLETVLRRHS